MSIILANPETAKFQTQIAILKLGRKTTIFAYKIKMMLLYRLILNPWNAKYDR